MFTGISCSESFEYSRQYVGQRTHKTQAHAERTVQLKNTDTTEGKRHSGIKERDVKH